MPYEVQLEVFQGPLDLLLHLIEREEMEITAVSIAQIADQYLLHLSLMQERVAADLADFLVVAARLLWIKSRALLPRPPQPISDIEEEDPAEALARQLREYRRFKEAAGLLQAREAAGLRAYVRAAPPPLIASRMIPGQVTIEDLLDALTQALLPPPGTPSAASVVSAVKVTVAQQIARIIEVTSKGSVRFRQLFARAASRVEIVVTLLALLELVKQRQVTMNQEQMFGEIEIARSEETVERGQQETEGDQVG